MKTTMKILPLLFGVMLFFTQCEKEAEMNAGAFMNLKVDDACSVTQPLYAGAGQNNPANGTEVGTVTATVNGHMLSVVYDVVAPWSGVEYHLWVGKREYEPDGRLLIPRNAAPGRFPYSGFASYEIDLDELGFQLGDPIYISAHAVVAKGDMESLEDMLPETVCFEVVANPNQTSYLLADVTDEDDFLTGLFDSYCIDHTVIIKSATTYCDADVFSSYSAEAAALVTYPLNFPKVNWLINNIVVGPDTYFSYREVQHAIWELLFDYDQDDNVGTPLNPIQVRVGELLELADQHGGYVPGCGDDLAIVLYDGDVQPIIIWKPVPCGDEETAWAFGGYTFIGEGIAKKWGWIFEMTYNNCPEE